MQQQKIVEQQDVPEPTSGLSKIGKGLSLATGRIFASKDAKAQPPAPEESTPEPVNKVLNEIVRLIDPKLRPLIIAKDEAFIALTKTKSRINGFVKSIRVLEKGNTGDYPKLTEILRRDGDGVEIRKQIADRKRQIDEISDTLARLKESGFIQQVEGDYKVAQARVDNEYTKLLHKHLYVTYEQRFVSLLLKSLHDAVEYGAGVRRYSQENGISTRKYSEIKAADLIKKRISREQGHELRGFIENYY